jgi:DNA-binding MarR family transcriptional regulator
MSITAVQKHVAVLERAGLVTKRRHGREQLVRCRVEALRTAQHLLDELEQVWRDRLDRFGAVLDELTAPDPGSEPGPGSEPEPGPEPTRPPTSP